MIFSLTSVPKKASMLLGFIVLLLTLLWVDSQETFTRKWIKSNYGGFERRQLWHSFSLTNRFLKGSSKDPRVVYEHSMLHRRAGTVRAFETLPLFSGRSTLEGVYIQASLSVPFVFYLQSEISQKPSTPIPDYNYSRFNLKRAVEHLKLFNVRDLIVVEPETKEAMKGFPEFRFLYRSGPYQVYELMSNSNRYVEPLKYKPVLATTREWRRLSYLWFRLGDLSVPIVFKDKIEEDDHDRFTVVDEFDIGQLPKHPVAPSPPLKEIVREEEVLIEGAAKGKPLLIKISYHPNWKVEGADKIYLVSPAFMLIYPGSSHVHLYYGRTWPDYTGALMTGLAILFMLLSRVYDFTRIGRPLSRWLDRYGTKATLGAMIMLALSASYYFACLSPEFPVLSYNKGIKYFAKEDYATAKKYFKEVLQRFPQTLLVDQAAYHYAMCFFREKDWDNTIRSLERLLETYPETRKAAEASYHMGLCYLRLGETQDAQKKFKETIKKFPKEIWAGYARDRLKEIQSP